MKRRYTNQGLSQKSKRHASIFKYLVYRTAYNTGGSKEEEGPQLPDEAQQGAAAVS